jgi:hypothetical protein
MKKYQVHVNYSIDRSAYVSVMADHKANAVEIAFEKVLNGPLDEVTFEDGEILGELDVIEIKEVPCNPYADWDMRDEAISSAGQAA